jgi:hypothetical protein
MEQHWEIQQQLSLLLHDDDDGDEVVVNESQRPPSNNGLKQHWEMQHGKGSFYLLMLSFWPR